MTTSKRRDRGQALVEFSLILIPFLWILMGIVDLGRGVYIYNGVNQAARGARPRDERPPVGRLAGVPDRHVCGDCGCRRNAAKLVPGFGGPGSTVTYACTT